MDRTPCICEMHKCKCDVGNKKKLKKSSEVRKSEK